MTLAEIVQEMHKEARLPMLVLNAHIRILEALEAQEQRIAALETAQQDQKSAKYRR